MGLETDTRRFKFGNGSSLYSALSYSTAGTAGSVVASASGSTSIDLLYAAIADNDFVRVRAGSTGSNAGFLEIATADDGTEPIHARQYTGGFTNIARTATLLDGSGNTSFPGALVAQSLRSSFASAAARNAAIPSPTEGMMCWLEDVNQVTVYVGGTSPTPGAGWYPVAGQMPKFAVRKIANQTVGSSTLATITFNTSGQIDLNRGGFSLSSNKVTVPLNGYYGIKGSIFFDASNVSGNNKQIRLYAGTSGSESIVSNNNYFGGLTLDWVGESTAEVYLTAGQVVYLAFYATGTGNHTVLSNTGAYTNYGTALMIDYLGP
jgi:hypothetical protein